MQYFNRYALNYNTFYCNLQILNDWSVGKKVNFVFQEGIEEDIRLI